MREDVAVVGGSAIGPCPKGVRGGMKQVVVPQNGTARRANASPTSLPKRWEPETSEPENS